MALNFPAAIHRLAALDFMNNDSFALPILMELGGQAVFYCSSEYTAKRGEVIEKLNKAGVEVVVDAYEKALSRKYFLSDQWARKPPEELKAAAQNDMSAKLQMKLAEKKVRYIMYNHGIDSDANPARVTASDFFLCTSELNLLTSVKAGKYLCDHQGRPLFGKMPNGAECAVGGVLHFSEEVLEMKKRGANSLQKELAERMGVEFTPSLPILLYMVPTHNDAAATDIGLKRLSRHANIIIRNLHFGESRPLLEVSSVTGPNIFQLTREQVADKYMYSLARMAVDAVMVGLLSASFVSSVMLGLPTIALITKTMMSDVPQLPFNYTVFLRNVHLQTIRLAHGVAPIDVEATDVLVERINDAAYWERYAREIKKVQDVIFGRYYIGAEAARQSAALIKRALAVGSFSPPQLPPGGSIKDGPLWHLSGLCPVTL